MNLQFLTQAATDRLAAAITTNKHFYEQGGLHSLIKPSDLGESRIETGAYPSLFAGDGSPLPDAAATRIIFQWLSRLSPVQAADERLWTYLCHSEYAKYVESRWTGLGTATKPEEFIRRRWFFRGEGVATFVQNALSRLWWFGYLTHDPERGNAFELTDTLLSLQDIQVAFLERSLGRCKPLLKAVLVAIRKHDQALKEAEGRGDIIQEWAKDIHLYGGAYVLDAVPPERLGFVVEQRLKQRLSL